MDLKFEKDTLEGKKKENIKKEEEKKPLKRIQIYSQTYSH